MRTGKRRIENGRFYEQFFDPPPGTNTTIKKGATLLDTMQSIKNTVDEFKSQSTKIAHHLKAGSVRETCYNIWKFCFKNFQYEKDEKGKEQIRTPARSWIDRHNYKGIDCDDFSTLIATCFEELQIEYVFRLTKYGDADESDEFEHIYVVAFDEEGEEIIMDAVVHAFDYEVPYAEKKDEEMDLEVLNGVEGRPKTNDLPIDAQDLFLNEDMELEGLEGRAERKAKKASRKQKRKTKRATRKETPLKERIRNGITKINKFNPATVLLRTGILASMKLNLFKVASHLRFAYWSDAQASKNGVDLGRFNQLKRVREKIEQIFYRAGGKPENLRKAILQGRGNRNKQVALNGLGSVSTFPTDYDDLKTILGDEIFYDEVDGSEGLQGLGAVATGAAVGAASGTMGVIAGLIKKIGNIFKRGSNAAKKFKAQDEADDTEEKNRRFSLKNIANKVRNKVQQRRERKRGEAAQEPENETITFDDDEEFDIPEEDFETIPEPDYNPPADTQTLQPDLFQEDEPTDTTDSGSESGSGSESTDKQPNAVMKWIKENQGLSWAIGGLTAAGLGFLGYRMIKKKKAKPKKKSGGTVSGISKKKKRTTKSKTTARRKSPVAKKRTTTRKSTNRRSPGKISRIRLSR